ncbi:hypothetical protein B0I35DRAFT_45149 [Stachybotrys elegans]|uniref:DUF8004 domain-containing protein n=1 Tax=Stachybotrys elegans TaxID=80388 RepID=A0A8K0T3C9_9HYPO|nr:hypothetical protein B0I35DRAFT_45149 [Stachybotrys elegans]
MPSPGYPRMRRNRSATATEPSAHQPPAVQDLKTIHSLMSGRAHQVAFIKRWDGSAKTCNEWTNLQRVSPAHLGCGTVQSDLEQDPDLWFLEGNCLVHLYAKGLSRKGPSFRVPFSGLLAAKCYPLIDRFLDPDLPRPRSLKDFHKLGVSPRRTIDLYIPPPSMLSGDAAFRCTLAIRNLFAWIYGQPLVGEYLGRTLIELMHSLLEFRYVAANNVDDVNKYLAHAGYLNFACQPEYVVACLQLAEAFHIKDLYIRAFAHSVGMDDGLYDCPDYQHVSFVTKKLLRKERSDLDSRLYQAADILRNFAEQELSEAHLGISAGGRAHLEHFRSFLMSFYTQQLGYFPPRSFDPDTYRAMREDFEALYDLLVDESYTTDGRLPSLAVGGICAIQHVQSFDARYGFQSLEHPLPLLPQSQPEKVSRRRNWLPRGDRVKPSERLAIHTALIDASNWKETVFRNDLVRAYRRFEEELVVSPQKADRREKLSIVDARKVRWILVYTVYQVLRNITDEPPEVRDDTAVPYHLAISAKDLPPWDDAPVLSGPSSRRDSSTDASPLVTWSDGESKHPSSGIEIKPDIDYFALTHKDPSTERKGSLPSSSTTTTPVMSRSNSFSRVLVRSNTIRKSMGIFKSGSMTSASSSPPVPPLPKQPYHEIVVHGYGNGTNNVRFDPGPERTDGANWATRSDSTASNSSSNTAPTLDSTDSRDTLDSTVQTPIHATPPIIHTELKQAHHVFSVAMPDPADSKPMRRRTMTTFLDSRTTRLDSDATAPAVPPRDPRRRNSLINDLRRRSYLPTTRSMMTRETPAAESAVASPPRNSDDWSAMEAFMIGDHPRIDPPGNKRMSTWEQYTDLGGLTEAR